MKVKIINKSGFSLPEYATEGSAAFDIRAVITEGEIISIDKHTNVKNFAVILYPEKQINISTGLYVAIPKGCAMLISGRSGNAMRYGISVTQGYGVIDSDYRGEIKVFLTNHGDKPFAIANGDRIAQGIITPYIKAEWEEVTTLDETERGAGGFGHTGDR